MTTISPFAAGSYTTSRTTSQLLSLKSQLNDLSTQLTSGLTAQTYGGLGGGRTTALSAQASISALNGYSTVIDTAQIRAKLQTTAMSQLVTVGNDTVTTLQNGLQSTSTDTQAAKSTALNNLNAALDALNQSDGSLYLFSGRKSSTQPVLTADTILNGTTAADGTKLDGLTTLVADQTKADLGTSSNGRLTQTMASVTSINLAEDSNAQTRVNFGFTLGTISTTGSGLTVGSATDATAVAPTATATFAQAPTEGQRFRVVVNQKDGSQKTIDFTTTDGKSGTVDNPFPITGSAGAAATALNNLIAPGTLASVQSAAATDTPPGPGLSLSFTGGTAANTTINVASQPSAGDTVNVTLALHDGTTTTLTLTASADPKATSPSFFIGANAPATAANLNTALQTALQGAAATTLTASSTARASQDFFAGSTSPGLAPRRITFDGSGNATGFTQTPSPNTVVWYQGDDTGLSARSTQTYQIGTSATVQLGGRANEAPIQSVLAGLATVAIGMPSGTTSNSSQLYEAIAAKASPLLAASKQSPSVQDIVTDFSLASARMTNAAATNKSQQGTLQDTVDGIEQASTEEVAVRLMDMQTRLQASYQLTASLSKLSLVNYIS